MSIKVTQLDARFAGYGQFKYVVESISNYKTGVPLGYMANVKNAFEWREWCWSTFGPSLERDWVVRDSFRDYEYKWCWHTQTRDCKIYLKGDNELAWFKLRFEGDNG